MTHVLGIYRERPHSPGRVDDDAAIMDAVAAALRRDGFAVDLLAADTGAVPLVTRGAGVFAMCEGDAILRRLDLIAASGTPVVNSPPAIRNTYRVRTAALFARARVSSPQSWVVDTHDPGPLPAPEVWVKRADYHATQADDVTFAGSANAYAHALAAFAARGLTQAVVQAHAPGDLVKFYGVADDKGGADWFHWFHHADQRLAGHPVDSARLQEAAGRAAAALGVEIFGGDAIVARDGAVSIIDLNAWPSFARCRDAAAAAIAARLADRFTPRADARLASTR